MIYRSLQFTRTLLEQFLKSRFRLTEGIAVLNYVMNPDGSMPAINQNKVVLSLINIEKENTQPLYTRNTPLNSRNYS